MLTSFLGEWAASLLRLAHVVTAAAWFGAFLHVSRLDATLAHGAAWRADGQRLTRLGVGEGAPSEAPPLFRWQAYMAWASGFLLMTALYYIEADVYLIDAARWDAARWQAVSASLAAIVLIWLAYDALAKSALARRPALLDAAALALVGGGGVLFTQIFSGRGAFLQTGAVIGTMIVANIAHHIAPAQRRMIAAAREAKEPSPGDEPVLRLRLRHNDDLALALMFFMLSSHLPLAFATRFNWAIAALAVIAGAATRRYFRARHAGQSPLWPYAAVAGAAAALMIVLSLLGRPAALQAATPAPAFAAARDIVASRCAVCHAAQPAWPGLAAAPKGVVLDTDAAIRRHARQIALQAAASRAMPPGAHADALSETERALLAAWASAETPN